MTTSWIDPLFSLGSVRKAVWRLWYPFLTRRLRSEDVIFLNYAYEEDPPLGIPLSPEDEPNRACIQLYHHVVSPVPLTNQTVVEVSCGHGGGASFLSRTFHPHSYTAIDLNPAAIQLCQTRHHLPALSFKQGDALNLPFNDASIDALINVEASHCYPDFERFLAEVRRVLRPSGHFLYADFRFSDRFQEWDRAFSNCGMECVSIRQINAEVLRGMRHNSARSLALVRRKLPKFLHSLGCDFAGTEGSRIYQAITSGEVAYRSYHLRK